MFGPQLLGQERPSHVCWGGVGVSAPLRQFGAPRTVEHVLGVTILEPAPLCLQTGGTVGSASVLKEKARQRGLSAQHEFERGDHVNILASVRWEAGEAEGTVSEIQYSRAGQVTDDIKDAELLRYGVLFTKPERARVNECYEWFEAWELRA